MIRNNNKDDNFDNKDDYDNYNYANEEYIIMVFMIIRMGIMTR